MSALRPRFLLGQCKSKRAGLDAQYASQRSYCDYLDPSTSWVSLNSCLVVYHSSLGVGRSTPELCTRADTLCHCCWKIRPKLLFYYRSNCYSTAYIDLGTENACQSWRNNLGQTGELTVLRYGSNPVGDLVLVVLLVPKGQPSSSSRGFRGARAWAIMSRHVASTARSIIFSQIFALLRMVF